MKKPTQNDGPDSQQEMEISHLAFDLWQRAGRPPGQYIEYWEKAKQRVIGAHEVPRDKSTTGAATTKVAAPAPRSNRQETRRSRPN